MIAVQTPGESRHRLRRRGGARDRRGASIAPTTVVLRSTAPLGTTRRIAEIIGAGARPAASRVASNPEFLVEGRAYEAFMQPGPHRRRRRRRRDGGR